MQDKERRNASSPSKAPVEHYWDWLVHEDNLFSSRINFFVVAQSMLFIAFAVVSGENLPRLTVILAVTGIAFTSIWLYVSISHIYWLINPIKAKLEEMLPEYRERKGIWRLGEPNLWLGIILPLVLMVVWIFLMIEK